MTDIQASKTKEFRNKVRALLRQTPTRRENALRSYMTLEELAEDWLYSNREDFSTKINGEMTRDEVEVVVKKLAKVEAIKRRSQARELFELRNIYDISSEYWNDEAFKNFKNDDPNEPAKPKEQPAPVIEHIDEQTLYRARARVSPKIYNRRFPRRNPFFTGREAQLEQLEQLLKENGDHPIAISGLGGIGKTQLVLEYAHRHHPKPYRTVFWVNAASSTTLQEDYDDLAHLLKLPERTNDNPDSRTHAVKLWLDRHSEWLLIMDNADDLPLASSFLPVAPCSGHIVLTTRSQIFGDITSVVAIEIEEMEPEDGLLFLLWRSGILNDKTKLYTIAADVRKAAVQLVQLLERFPLALDQASAYIDETRVSLAEYIQLYQKKRQALLKWRGSSKSPHGQHPESVAATFELSLEKAREQHPQAADLLHFCAFLQPDAMPEEVLLQADDLKLDAFSLNEVVVALRRYSLIDRHTQDKTFSMHRLVQAVLIDSMSPDLREQWRACVVRALAAIFPEEARDALVECERLLPHVLICMPWIEHVQKPVYATVRLLDRVGIYLRVRGQYTEAEPLLIYTCSICEQLLGLLHPDTARSLSSLANLYWTQGKYEQAEPLYQRALAIREQQLGSLHPETADSLNNLAVIYWTQGKEGQAEPLYQRALAIKEQQLGPTHPDTARSLNNLANLYYRQGKYEQAEPLYQRALAIQEQQLGPLHQGTAHSLHGLAVLYRDQNKHEQAGALFMRALAIREQTFDPNHIDLAETLYEFAILQQAQGHDKEAWSLYERALVARTQTLGAMHPQTQEARKNYATFLRSIKRNAEAAVVESGQKFGVDE